MGQHFKGGGYARYTFFAVAKSVSLTFSEMQTISFWLEIMMPTLHHAERHLLVRALACVRARMLFQVAEGGEELLTSVFVTVECLTCVQPLVSLQSAATSVTYCQPLIYEGLSQNHDA